MLMKLLVGAAALLTWSVVAPAPANAAPPLSAEVSTGASVLAPGTTLAQGQSIWSKNRQYRLAQQSDGNLVLYRAGTAIWSSRTAGAENRTVMQADGNLVVRSKSNQPLFHTGTAPNPGAALVVQNDGNLVVYAPSGRVLWASRR